LSQDELLVVPCDKENLCVDASFTSMPQVVNKSDTFCLEPSKCVEAKLFRPITCAQDELKLMSSLNTLGYIEFDILVI
jgi:S-adenosylmethionine:tRNA-ribosyltransferase-isomerase (queuine synthetase)